MISKQTIVACLTVSAIIFAVLLVFEMTMEPNEAAAEVGATSRAGNFVMATAAQPDNKSLLWITNVMTQQIIVCEDTYDGEIRVLDRVDLVAVFGE